LWYNYVQTQKTPAALCSNDAKSCYDWIVLLVAALCMCQLRAAKSLLLGMVKVLHGMHHHTQTAHGDSSWYTSRLTWETPVASIGQGNGTGLAIRAVVSSLLFKMASYPL